MAILDSALYSAQAALACFSLCPAAASSHTPSPPPRPNIPQEIVFEQSDPVPPPPLKTLPLRVTLRHMALDQAAPTTPASSLDLSHPRSQAPSHPRAFACAVPTARTFRGLLLWVLQPSRPTRPVAPSPPLTPAPCVRVILTITDTVSPVNLYGEFSPPLTYVPLRPH